MTRTRWMALFFALGSTCFLIGPFPGYAKLVGEPADGITFFVGSVLFTAGGALQSWIAWPERRSLRAGRAAWWSAVIQSAGTLFFNVSTFQAMHTAVASSDYNRLVWRPDAFGSICFLVSGAIAYLASARHGWLPARGRRGWWQPAVNLLGCVFFGISAVAGYVVPSTGSVLDLAAANWNTCLGAACFLTCAVDTLFRGSSPKSKTLGELRELEHAVERDLPRVVCRRRRIKRSASRRGPRTTPTGRSGGRGFGGMAAAKRLRGADVDVTVIDRMNHHLAQLLQHQVATGALSFRRVRGADPRHAQAPGERERGDGGGRRDRRDAAPDGRRKLNGYGGGTAHIQRETQPGGLSDRGFWAYSRQLRWWSRGPERWRFALNG